MYRAGYDVIMFTHLHTHLETSKLDSISKLSQAPAYAASLGFDALAITDHGNLSGTYMFRQACMEAGIKPILGQEFYLAIGSRFDRNEIPVLDAENLDGGEKTKRYEHITLLAATEEGWRNLVQLTNKAEDSYWYKPRIDYDLMAQHSEGIICLTGCLGGPILGPLSRRYLMSDEAVMESYQRRYDKVLPTYEAALDELTAITDQIRQMVGDRLGDISDVKPSTVVLKAETYLKVLAKDTKNKSAIVEKLRADLPALVKEGKTLMLDMKKVEDEYLTVKGTLDFDGAAEAKANLERMIDIYGTDRVFVELMEHGIEEESAILPLAVKLADRLGVRCVATNDSHYTRPEDAEAHDTWIAIQSGSTKNDKNRWAFSGSGYHIRSEDEMRGARDEDWWAQACDNTQIVADMIADDVFPEYRLRLPHFPLPDDFDGDSTQYMVTLAVEGGEKILGKPLDQWPQVYRDRLKFERDIISQMGMSDYMLIVEDVVSFARSDFLPHDWIEFIKTGHASPDREKKRPIESSRGRGSAAGSLIAYFHGVHQVDPIEHDLLFERFLDVTRIGMPDIDSDFERERRYEILGYLAVKYGYDHVAHIGSHATSKTKKVMDMVGKSLGIKASDINRAKKMLPTMAPELADLWGDDTSKHLPAFDREISLLENKYSVELIEEFKDTCLTTENVINNDGIHACGIVVSDEPLTDMIPLRKDRKKNPTELMITQWDWAAVEGFGLLKLDILGIKTLDVVAESARQARSLGANVSVEDIPHPNSDRPDVARTWHMLQRGSTSGCFQIEGESATQLVKDIRPERWEDLTATNALHRPGPMKINAHTEYARRKNGARVDWSDVAATREEREIVQGILGDTYGINVYQEQSMILGRDVAGFNVANVNWLRKAISKKIEADFPQLREMFIEGATSSTTQDGQPKVAFKKKSAQNLWQSIEGSAKYAFNKCVAGHETVTALGGQQWPIAELYHRLNGGLEVSGNLCQYCGQRPSHNQLPCQRCDVYHRKVKNRGLYLLAYDEKRGAITPQKMKNVYYQGERNTRVLVAGDKRIQVTYNHRLRTDAGYRYAGDIKVGDRLMVATDRRSPAQVGRPGDPWSRGREVEYAPVTDIFSGGMTSVYDIEMDEGTDHNFVASGIVSHNSHSAAYAKLGFETAYMKANYPAAFYSAQLTIAGEKDKRLSILARAAGDGVTILPPDVNRPHLSTTAIDETTAVFGLSEILHIGQAPAQAIVENLPDGGYTSLAQLIELTGISATVIEALAYAGALDAFGSRRGIAVQSRALARHPNLTVYDLPMGALATWFFQQKYLGISMGDHPLADTTQYAEDIDDARTDDMLTIADLGSVDDGAYVRFVGLVERWAGRVFGGGNRMVNVTLSDTNVDSINGVVWSNTLDAIEKRQVKLDEPDISEGMIVVANGRVTVREIEVASDEGDIDDEGAEASQIVYSKEITVNGVDLIAGIDGDIPPLATAEGVRHVVRPPRPRAVVDEPAPAVVEPSPVVVEPQAGREPKTKKKPAPASDDKSDDMAPAGFSFSANRVAKATDYIAARS